MDFTFVPVNEENRNTALSLHISKSQKGTVETVAECLEEAARFPLWRPVIIETLGLNIGFAMYGLWQEEGRHGRVWLDRFFIHESFQGKGYAKACMPLLISHILESYGRRELYLSVYVDNLPAIKLYKACGFDFNGELDINGERVMLLTL